MYVVGAKETDLSYAQIVIENLKKADANVLETVLNKLQLDKEKRFC